MMVTEQPFVTGDTLADRLKQTTSQLHHEVEHHAFQQALLGGTLPLHGYVDWLGQMGRLHGCLERLLYEHALTDASIAAISAVYGAKLPCLVRDLQFFGVDPERVAPMSGVAAMEEEFDAAVEESPAALFGYLYVLEGSTNGGKFIAVRVRKSYGFTDQRGTRYLDPYGVEQPIRWSRFRSALNTAELSPTCGDAAIQAAGSMFRGLGFLFDELWGHSMRTGSGASADRSRNPE